jgi:uncharacterized protein with ATP-grasp and redox domains
MAQKRIKFNECKLTTTMKIIKISESSHKYKWELNDEIFDFLSKRFDVRKAKEIINNTPHREIMNIGLSGVASMVPRKSIQKKLSGCE